MSFVAGWRDVVAAVLQDAMPMTGPDGRDVVVAGMAFAERHEVTIRQDPRGGDLFVATWRDGESLHGPDPVPLGECVAAVARAFVGIEVGYVQTVIPTSVAM